MTDASWDNQGMGAPPKSGLPTWAKVLLGCGIVAVLLVGACVGGVTWLSQKAKKDPEAFERGAKDFATSMIRPDYEHGAAVVRQLQTEAGCRALWLANPGLHVGFGDETAFLKAVEGWRPHLQELPPLTAEALDKNHFDLTKEPFSGVRFGYKMADGSRLRMGWDGSDRKLTRLEFTIAAEGARATEGKP